MQIKHVVFMILMISVSITAFAADSESNRDKFDFLCAVTPWALSNGSPASFSYSLSMYYNKRIALSVKIGRISYDYESGDSDDEVKYSNIGFGGRYFFGNSLNMLGGLHNRKWEGEKSMTTLSGAYGEAEIEATSNALIFGLGHQWVNDFGLTWGIDWVVVALATGSSSSVSIKENDGLTSDEEQALIKSAKETADDVNQVALASAAIILSAGWSF